MRFTASSPHRWQITANNFSRSKKISKVYNRANLKMKIKQNAKSLRLNSPLLTKKWNNLNPSNASKKKNWSSSKATVMSFKLNAPASGTSSTITRSSWALMRTHERRWPIRRSFTPSSSKSLCRALSTMRCFWSHQRTKSRRFLGSGWDVRRRSTCLGRSVMLPLARSFTYCVCRHTTSATNSKTFVCILPELFRWSHVLQTRRKNTSFTCHPASHHSTLAWNFCWT